MTSTAVLKVRTLADDDWIIIGGAGAGGNLPEPGTPGRALISLTDTTWSAVDPVTSEADGWLINPLGKLVVNDV